MKLTRLNVLGTPTWELLERHLGDERVHSHLARHAAVGELIYAPPHEGRPMRYRDAAGAQHEGADPVKPSRPDPKRVEPLRAALRRAGYELADRGAYYFEVVQR